MNDTTNRDLLNHSEIPNETLQRGIEAFNYARFEALDPNIKFENDFEGLSLPERENRMLKNLTLRLAEIIGIPYAHGSEFLEKTSSDLRTTQGEG